MGDQRRDDLMLVHPAGSVDAAQLDQVEDALVIFVKIPVEYVLVMCDAVAQKAYSSEMAVDVFPAFLWILFAHVGKDRMQVWVPDVLLVTGCKHILPENGVQVGNDFSC